VILALEHNIKNNKFTFCYVKKQYASICHIPTISIFPQQNFFQKRGKWEQLRAAGHVSPSGSPNPVLAASCVPPVISGNGHG